MNLNKIKNYIINFITKTKNYMIDNKLFSIYILLSTILCFSIRMLTTMTILNYKPLITDLGLIIIFGSFVFLIKTNQKRYLYLQLLLCFYTLICVINAIYYAFYTSFASITSPGLYLTSPP